MKGNRLLLSKRFEELFSEWEKEYPDWKQWLTGANYYCLMDWYNNKHCLPHFSDKANEFAQYICERYLNEEKDTEESNDSDTLNGEIDFYEDGPFIDLKSDDVRKLVEIYNLQQDDKVELIFSKIL